MGYLAWGFGVVIAVVVAVFLVVKALDSEAFFSVQTIGAVIFFSLLLAFLAYTIDKADKKGPCVSYETQMHYNAATKTMMPARVCTLRGEWVK